MDCSYLEKISLLIDGKLSASEAVEVRSHIAECAECARAERNFLALREQIKSIQTLKNQAAQRKVLNRIMRGGRESRGEKTDQIRRLTLLRPIISVSVILLIIVGAVGIFLYTRDTAPESWNVAILEGHPLIGLQPVAGNSRLKVGEWLETDDQSKAKLAVADIGSVEVQEETKVRLVETRPGEHRLELEHGFIAAKINAPPRLFFVNTPSATVIDYGCAYTLNVDDEGTSVLHVSEGWVSLDLNGRAALVPASAYATARRGIGPGTPYFEDASGEFTVALAKFDFENGGAAAIDVILRDARERDSLSLWYLLERTDEADRARIFDRLASFVSLPADTTREGILSLNREMLDSWKETIEVISVGNSFDSGNQSAVSGNSGRLASTGSMNTPRAGHTATRLLDGRVLITGGIEKEAAVLQNAEIFDPHTSTFSPTGNMNIARVGHTATLLPNGKILIVGGANAGGNSLPSAELYDPASGMFSPTGNLETARANHQATLLPNGKVLITGGLGSNHAALRSAEIYDAEKGIFIAVENMNAARQLHAAALLDDGNVLIAGGNTGSESAETTLSSVEIYDSLTGKFALIGNMTAKRYSHAAVKLTDGRVLIAGGSTGREWKGLTRSAEIYDPRRKSFMGVGEMSLPRFKHQAATLRLLDNRILIAGSGARLEIFDPATDSFSSTPGNVGTGRIFSTVTLLADGKVLIAGGYNFDYPPTANAWIYSP